MIGKTSKQYIFQNSLYLGSLLYFRMVMVKQYGCQARTQQTRTHMFLLLINKLCKGLLGVNNILLAEKRHLSCAQVRL